MGTMGRQRTQFDVSLKTLIDHGLLKVGPKSLLLEARNKVRKGDLKEDGSILFEGKIFQSASSFAVAALRSAGAKTRMTANGWQLVSSNGRSLEIYRAEYIRSVYGVSSPVRQYKAQSSETVTRSSTPPPPDSPPAGGNSTPPKNPDTAERVDVRASPDSPTSVRVSVGESRDSQKGEGEIKRMGTSPKKRRAEEVVWTESAGTCSDDATTDLVGQSRKRTAPRPELQMWLKKALKKRHVESQALLHRNSGDVC
ncbi:hypothetical protein BSKO_04220 [Bryopsis sp. KO-2023]|nr:hypothetical protein BSKO_04220 [Bryopsis sp. KO-2023]